MPAVAVFDIPSCKSLAPLRMLALAVSNSSAQGLSPAVMASARDRESATENLVGVAPTAVFTAAAMVTLPVLFLDDRFGLPSLTLLVTVETTVGVTVLATELASVEVDADVDKFVFEIEAAQCCSGG